MKNIKKLLITIGVIFAITHSLCSMDNEISRTSFDLKMLCAQSLLNVEPQKFVDLIKNDNKIYLPDEIFIFLAQEAIKTKEAQYFVDILSVFPFSLYTSIALKIYCEILHDDNLMREDFGDNEQRTKVKIIVSALKEKSSKNKRDDIIILKFLKRSCDQDLIELCPSDMIWIKAFNDSHSKIIVDFLFKENFQHNNIFENVVQVLECPNQRKRIVRGLLKNNDIINDCLACGAAQENFANKNRLKYFYGIYQLICNTLLNHLQILLNNGIRPNPEGFVAKSTKLINNQEPITVLQYLFAKCEFWSSKKSTLLEYAECMLEQSEEPIWSEYLSILNAIGDYYTTHRDYENAIDIVDDESFCARLPEFKITAHGLRIFYRGALKMIKPLYPKEFAAYKNRQNKK